MPDTGWDGPSLGGEPVDSQVGEGSGSAGCPVRACAGSKQEAGLGAWVGDPGPARAALQPRVTEVDGDIVAAADSGTMLCAHARVLDQVVLVVVLRMLRLVGDSGPYARGCRRTWEPRFPLIQGWACLMLDLRNTWFSVADSSSWRRWSVSLSLYSRAGV